MADGVDDLVQEVWRIRIDENVERTATGQTDGDGLVVRVAKGERGRPPLHGARDADRRKDRFGGIEPRERLGNDGPLDAPTRHRPDDLSSLGDRHHGARFPRS